MKRKSSMSYCGVPIYDDEVMRMGHEDKPRTYRFNLPPIRTVGQLRALSNLIEMGVVQMRGQRLKCSASEAEKIPKALRKKLGKFLVVSK